MTLNELHDTHANICANMRADTHSLIHTHSYMREYIK